MIRYLHDKRIHHNLLPMRLTFSKPFHFIYSDRLHSVYI